MIFAALAFAASLYAQPFVAIEMVTVGDPGNAADTTGYGAVDYLFAIGKYEVTLSQYTAFLNAVAKTDTYGLYNTNMETNLNIAGIARSGSSGYYTYSTMGSGNRPVTYVSWFDAARFANWMANGQPTGLQGNATTENGAYPLNGATSGVGFDKNAINPNTGASPSYWIPSENEWYKAAFYDPIKAGSQKYWLYPTRSDTAPGNTIGVGANQANYRVSGGSVAIYSVTQTSVYSSSQNYLTDGGSFSGSGSYYGTFDQGGNQREWNDAVISSWTEFRGVRGAAWSDSIFSYMQSSHRGSTQPNHEHDFVGFRIAGKGNRAPVFNSLALNTTYGAPLEVPISSILTGASDPDGDTLTVLSVGPVTSAGGGLSLTPVSTLVYTPPDKFAGTDTFSVTYADPDGATVVGLVTVTVQPIDVTLTATGSNGTVTISPTKSVYQTGDTVTLTAVPASGFDFSGWFGALSGNTNPATFVLEADATVHANFFGKPGTLSVEQSGTGTTTLTFDSRRLGASPVALTVVLRNSGQGTIFDLSLALTGAAASDYTLVGLVPQSFAPGEQANLTVAFSPRGPGDREAVLSINASSGLTTPINMNLSGSGVADTVVPTLVKDIRPGATTSSPHSLTAVGNRVFFVANDGVHGSELWVSDGTDAGTMMVKDIAPGSASAAPGSLVGIGELLVFSAGEDGIAKIWRSDGTFEGTYPIYDVTEGSIGGLYALGGRIYFTLKYQIAEQPEWTIYPITTVDVELWSTDGSAEGTELHFLRSVDNYEGGSFPPGSIDFGISQLGYADGAVFFVTALSRQSSFGTGSFDGSFEERLFRLNILAAGGVSELGLWTQSTGSGPSSSPMPSVGNFAEMGGSLYFYAPGMALPPFGGSNTSPALWRVDAGASYATLVEDGIHTFSQISTTPGTSNMIAVGSRLFFGGKRQTDMDPSLWTSDGTADGTGPVVIDEIYGTMVSNPWGFTRFGDHVFFAAHETNMINDVEPWIADATRSDVRRIRDIRPGNVASLPLYPVVRAGAVFFTADDGVNGRQIWKTFGTEASTMRLADTFGGGAGLTVDGPLVGAGAKIFFVAPAAGAGNELHVLDLGVQSREQIGGQIAEQLASAGLPPEQAAPDAEPFGDGVSNLLKFAFNMNLAGPDSTQLTPGEGTGGLPAVGVNETPSGEALFQVDFIRRKDSALIYVPKVSTNLRDFTPMTGTVTVTPIDADWERVTVSEPYPEGPNVRRFSVIDIYLP
jgi:ELWxxDGT repeat protein